MSVPLLSRERIVSEAIALLDDEGPGALSMRRLAGRLGTSTMSTYHYVPDKAALVEAIAEQIMSDLDQPAEDVAWDEALRTMATSFRALTRRHPGVFALLLSGRRPAAMLRTAEGVVARLESAGFSHEDALTVFRITIRYLLGSALVEADAQQPGDTVDATFAAGLDALIAGVATWPGAPTRKARTAPQK